MNANRRREPTKETWSSRKYDDNWSLAQAIDNALGTTQKDDEVTPQRENLVKDLQASWEDIKRRTEKGENTKEEQLAFRVHLASQTQNDNSELRTKQAREDYVKGQILVNKLIEQQGHRGQSEEEFAKDLEKLNARIQKALEETDREFERRGIKTAREVYGE